MYDKPVQKNTNEEKYESDRSKIIRDEEKKKCSPAAVGHLLDNKVLNVASPNI